NSYVVKTAQAARPFVLDMFEPQDHPNDFRYPGGPPIPPYDVTGWTLAFQMGLQFDRVLDGFDGPFVTLTTLESPAPSQISTPANPAGFLISHRVNNSFIVANRILKNGGEVYWLKSDGTIWVPYSSSARAIVERGAKELGVVAQGVDKKPSGEALKL